MKKNRLLVINNELKMKNNNCTILTKWRVIVRVVIIHIYESKYKNLCAILTKCMVRLGYYELKWKWMNNCVISRGFPRVLFFFKFMNQNESKWKKNNCAV